MMSEGLFLLDLEIPALLLSKWLGSADDDDRGPGVHLDLTRQVKVVFSGPNDQQGRIAGRLPTVGPGTAASAPSGSTTDSPAEPQADIEVMPLCCGPELRLIPILHRTCPSLSSSCPDDDDDDDDDDDHELMIMMMN